MHPIYSIPQWVPAQYPTNHPDPRLRKNPGSQERRQQLLNTYDHHTQTTPGHHVGWVATPHDEYVLIDIDAPKELKGLPNITPNHIHAFIATLPQDLQRLIAATYTEISASGIGLRAIVKLQPDSALRRLSSNWIKATTFEGQVNLHDGFMICTRNVLTDKPSVQVADSWFEKHFRLRAAAPTETPQPADLTTGEIQQLIGLELLQRLQRLPLDPSNTKVHRAYKSITGESYEHYEYWRLVAAATRDYAALTYQSDKGFIAFHEWSRKDPEAYTSEVDCRRTWDANPPRAISQDGPTAITYKTLIRLLRELEYTWPEPVISKSGDVRNKPIETSHRNFTYFLEFHDITLYRNPAGQYFLTGDNDTLAPYFSKPDKDIIIDGKTLGKYYGPFEQPDLVNILAAFMQTNGYGSHLKTATVDALVSTFSSRMLYKPFNIMQAWLQTPFDELPHELQYVQADGAGRPVGKVSKYNYQSTLEFICKQISLHHMMPDETRYEILYKSLRYFFMGMAKLLTQHTAGLLFDENAGMLLLVGGEGTRKTTFFKFLLPKALQEMCVYIPKGFTKEPSEKQMRDLYRRIATSGYIVFDEFDAIPASFMQAEMKKFISDNQFQFTEIYSSGMTTLPRHAGIGGTTNDFDLRLSDHGNRRIWPILVGDYDSKTGQGGINTDALLRFNWHKFYNDMIAEFEKLVREGKTPWLPSTEDLKLFESVQNIVATETNLGMFLRDLYPYEEPFNRWDEVTSVQVKDHPFLKALSEVAADLTTAGVRFSRPELKHALQRYCGEYTQTKNMTRQLKKYYCKDGQVVNTPHKRWILPEKKSSF